MVREDELVKWILENCPQIVYPEEKGYIQRDRERWRQRIWYIGVRMGWI